MTLKKFKHLHLIYIMLEYFSAISNHLLGFWRTPTNYLAYGDNIKEEFL